MEPCTLNEGPAPPGALPVRFSLLIAMVVVFTLVLLGPALGGPYLWDDESLIRDNPLVHGFSRWGTWFTGALFDGRTGVGGVAEEAKYFRPLVLASFAVDWLLGGGNPAVGHATSLAIYAVVLAMIAELLLRWHRASWLAVIAVALYALHPTHVESVAWLSGRADLLVLLGYLLAGWGAWERFQGKRWCWMLEVVGTVVAYLSKESAIALPLFVLLPAWLAEGRPALSGTHLWTVVKRVLPQVATAAVYLGLRAVFLPIRMAQAAPDALSGGFARVQLFFETLGRASAMTVFPWPNRGEHGLVALTATHELAFNGFYVGFGVVTAIGVAISLVVVWRRNPAAFLGILFALGVFLPVSNLVPTRLRCFFFERYLLLPHLGLLLAGVVLVRERKWKVRWSHVAVPALMLVLAYRSHERARDFADADRFWRHEVAVNPQSSVAPAALLSQSSDPLEAYQWSKRCEANARARRQRREARSCQLGGLEVLLGNSPDASEAMLTEVRGELMRLASTDLVRSYPGRVDAALATVESRLSRDAVAVAAARRSLTACSTCGWVPPLAFVFAAAGDYPSAHATLGALKDGPFATVAAEFEVAVEGSEEWATKSAMFVGPQKLHAMAQRFLALGRYEAAYQILVSAEPAIVQAPELADDFAMVAFRAGHTAHARRILLGHRRGDQVENIVGKWEMASTSLGRHYAE